MFKRFFQKQKDKEISLEVRLDSMIVRLDSLPYIMADDGKDKVVNRHLFKRSEELGRKADRLKRIADRLDGK